MSQLRIFTRNLVYTYWTFILLAIIVIIFIFIVFYYNQFENALLSLFGGLIGELIIILIVRSHSNNTENRYPKVFMSFSDHGSNGPSHPNFQINYINKGNKVAHKVNCFVIFASDEEIEVKQYGGYNASANDLTENNLKEIMIYNHKYVFEFIFPKRNMNTQEIYPSRTYSYGYISILDKDMDKIKKIIVLTLEENGSAKQEFKVVLEKDKRNFEEIKSEFKLHQ